MTWLITKFISALLLPPLNFLLLGVAGLTILKKRPALGRGLLWSMIALMWIFSLPVVGDHLARILEKGSKLEISQQSKAQAIVVLGGGGGSLEHTRYAAKIYRRTKLPILVTGGGQNAAGIVDAERMRKSLEEEFNVPVRWVEKSANDTIQNAEFSSKILKANGVDSILLVTHGWHMARSKQLFERAGFKVIPVGVGLHWDTGLTVLDFLPTAQGLEGSRLFFHEVIGMVWSKLATTPDVAGST
jgi:uncharacterized SAM-binding protein YcdF (DUF218 family)